MVKHRILFVNGHLNVGGVERSLVDLLRSLDYSKYDIDLLLLEGTGVYIEQIPSEVRVICQDLRKSYGPFFYMLQQNLKNKMLKNIYYRIILFLSAAFGKVFLRFLMPLFKVSTNYDCAIAYRPGICSDIVAYTIRSQKRICWWHHGECNYTYDQIKELKKTWELYDNIVTVSHGCKEMLISVFCLKEDKVKVIPNIIDFNEINRLAGTISPYAKKDKITIITVGNLFEEKHIQDIPYVSKMIKERIKDSFSWYIIGDGPLFDTVSKDIIKMDLSNNVFLLGKKTNPYPYIKYADIYVHTSLVESQCISILEAMSLLTPCVACKTIGTNEYMKTRVNGILVEKGIDNIFNGIIELLEIKSVEKMVASAYSVVSTNFSPSVVINAFDKIIRN